MKKSYLKIIIAIEVIGIVLQGLSVYEVYGSTEESIERPEAYEKSRQERLLAEGYGLKKETELSVKPVDPTDEQIEEVFDEAVGEIDDRFFGENKSAEVVWKKVNIESSYADGLAEASWDFSPRGIVDAAGNIDYGSFEDKQIVTATCTLEVFEKTRDYSFPFVVVQPDAGTEDGFWYLTDMALSESNEDSSDGELILPKDINGERLTWHKPLSYDGALLCLLGIVTGIALYVGTGIDEKKEREKRSEQFGREYPDIVENLCLYVGAGISVRVAFEKMEEQYAKWRIKHPNMKKAAYENLILMNRAIRDGRLETDAYEGYGRACVHPAYRKLSILLKQNLKRGNERLLEQLAHEEQLVADARRREIKSAGELISTKLLIPMGGLLMMILIVLIVPALRSISL